MLRYVKGAEGSILAWQILKGGALRFMSSLFEALAIGQCVPSASTSACSPSGRG